MLYDLKDKQWERIKESLPGKKGDSGRSAKDNRKFIAAVMWIGRTGAPWRALPEEYGKWFSVHKRFIRLAKAGHISMQLVLKKNEETEEENQGLGRSKGGYSTKLHAACDALGNPLRFFVTAGQRSDYVKALDLVEGKKMAALIADKGYDANYMIKAAEAINAEPVIPPRSNRKTPREYDKELYKERNLIERMFNKLKNFRRVATRYDKLAISFLSFVHIASIYLWLK
ncbi:Transposase DDE domain,Putative transposase IS4/IS5 family [Cinara cedri]|uniref:Transposase DDE domain,Putative transposase IS4/IS5 family n=4 Tax=cellular organisms TaxID=131567 RepID=A0A5E4NJE2_9HEMI|nr:Transposase DDE domain,Putative transposase IS4/IS5 family [Cinara cedri]